MRPPATLAAPILFLCCAQGAAAGPWPPGQSAGFAAHTPHARAEANADALGFNEIYAESGAAPGWTMGVDAWRTGAQDEDWTGLAFARRHLWTSPDGDVFSAQLGLGYLSTPERGERPRLRSGLSWGRGFGGGWGAGWVAVDARAEFQSPDAEPSYTADFTAGIKTEDGLMLIMQVQTDRDEDGAISARFAPSAVMRLSDGVRMEFSVAAGVVNDSSASVSLGTWLEF